jgi:hypothetical protein
MSMVIHYFFEGSKFWTPLQSSPSKRIYRDKKNFIDQRFYDEKIMNEEIKYQNLWVKYYKNKYKDLSTITDEAAIKHYYKHGIFENREFFKRDFNWKSYQKDNKDIEIKTEIDAISHYIDFGMFKK